MEDASLDEKWEQWKITFNKKYSSQEEEKKRRAIWEETLRVIEEHNKEEALGMSTYTMGLNHMSDLRKKDVAVEDNVPNIPKSDYNKKGMVTPVKDQIHK